MGSRSVPRPRKACERCKELKSRCRSAIDAVHPEDPCTRCSRLGLDCHYMPGRKRGRRPGAKIGNPATDKHLRFASSSDTQRIEERPPDGTSERPPSHSPLDQPDPSGTLPDSPSPSEQSSRSSSTPEPQRVTGSLTKLGGPAARNALDHLEPYLGQYDSRPGTPKGRRTAGLQDDIPIQVQPAIDAVTLGILSEAEAAHLFTITMQNILVASYMFDPLYSTYIHIRSKSILFTTILWLGSLFFRPVLTYSLFGLSDTMISRCITSGNHDLALAQALLISVLWSKPADRSTGIKIAVVKAILWELKVDDDFKQSLPTDSTLARAKLDRERALVVAMGQNSLHCVIQETRQPIDYWGVTADQLESWGPAHRHLNIHGDIVLSFSMKQVSPMATLIVSLLEQLGFQTDGPLEAATDETWATKEETMQHAIDVILRDPSTTGALRHHLASIAHGIVMNLLFIRWQQSQSLDNLHALLGRIDSFVDAFASCASSGIIMYWPHTSCVLLSQPAVMLFKMITAMVGPLRERAQLLLQRCLEICDTLASLPLDHAIHHVRRCYKRVLGVYSAGDGIQRDYFTVMTETSSESLDPYYARIFGFDPDDSLFQYENWAGHPEI